MPAPITGISGLSPADFVKPALDSRGGGQFQEVLSTAIRDVEAFGKDAGATVERFLSGEGEELHTTVLATQRAEMAFDLFLQARNKVVQAYQEIMRMQM